MPHHIRTPRSSLWLIGSLYVLGILLPAVVLTAFLVDALERERTTKVEKRALERRDAVGALRASMRREIDYLRTDGATPAAHALRVLRGSEAPITLRDGRWLPFETERALDVADLDRSTLDPAFLAGQIAANQGDLEAALDHYASALASAQDAATSTGVQVAMARAQLALERYDTVVAQLDLTRVARAGVATAMLLDAHAIVAAAERGRGRAEAAARIESAARAAFEAAIPAMGIAELKQIADRWDVATTSVRRALDALAPLYAVLDETRRAFGTDPATIARWPGPDGDALLVLGPPDPLNGDRPLRSLAVDTLVGDAWSRATGVDRAFTHADPEYADFTASLPPTGRTIGLHDRDPVPASLWADAGARLVLVLVALTLAGLFLGLVLTLAAVRKNARLTQLRADFISSVSHELKTPLTSIRLLSDLLCAGRVPAEKRDRYHALINDEAGKLQHLVGNILDHARIERGERIERIALDLGEVTRRIVDSFDARAEAAGVHIDRSAVASPAPIDGDENAIERIVANLVDNAIKYGGERIAVRTERTEDFVSLVVQDHGPGIPLADRERVFERFARGAHHGPDRPAGSGLGLAIVADLVAQHDGRITLDETPGGGTTLTVTFAHSSSRPHETGLPAPAEIPEAAEGDRRSAPEGSQQITPEETPDA